MRTVRKTTAEALIAFLDQQFLEDDGTETKLVPGILAIFGHGNIGGIGHALEASGAPGGLRFIAAKNEQGMVHAAVAFAKARRRRAWWACTSSIGPGAMNMVTGAALATVNRLPVLLLPGDVFSDRGPDPVLQQLEHPLDGTISVNDALRPVSVYWDRIQRPPQLVDALLRAVAVLTDPAATGAVTLCLPQDVQAEAYDFPAELFTRKVWHLARPRIDRGELSRSLDVIRASKHPLLVVGGGVHYSGAETEVAEFASRFGIPLAETAAGKGLVPWDHPWNLGGLGVLGTQAANRGAKSADLVIAMGTRLTDFTTASKTAFAKEVRFLALNVNRRDAGKLGAVPVIADVREGVRQWSEELARLGWQSEEDPVRIKTLKADWDQEVERLCSRTPAEGLAATSVLGQINRALDPSDVVVAAAGGLPGDLQRLWRSPGGATYHLEYGFSCMGYEVAAALGVKLADSSRGVYALVGDGSYLMLHTELLTAIQEGLAVTVVIFDNAGHQCIQSLAENLGLTGMGTQFCFRDPVRRGQPLAVDFVAYAQALGALAIRANSLEELTAALERARQAKWPAVIHVPVLPDSGTQAYEAVWRVDTAATTGGPS